MVLSILRKSKGVRQLGTHPLPTDAYDTTASMNCCMTSVFVRCVLIYYTVLYDTVLHDIVSVLCPFISSLKSNPSYIANPSLPSDVASPCLCLAILSFLPPPNPVECNVGQNFIRRTRLAAPIPSSLP